LLVGLVPEVEAYVEVAIPVLQQQLVDSLSILLADSIDEVPSFIPESAGLLSASEGLTGGLQECAALSGDLPLYSSLPPELILEVFHQGLIRVDDPPKVAGGSEQFVGTPDREQQGKEAPVAEAIHGAKTYLESFATLFEDGAVAGEELFLDGDAALGLPDPSGGATKLTVSLEHADFERFDLPQDLTGVLAWCRQAETGKE
jgi:hypothetical protein